MPVTYPKIIVPPPDEERLYGAYVGDTLILTRLLKPSYVEEHPLLFITETANWAHWKLVPEWTDVFYEMVVSEFDRLYAMTEEEDWLAEVLTLENLLIGIAVGGLVILGVGGVIAVGLEISAFVSSLLAELTIIAEAIHLKTALKIHNISMLISADYREMWSGFYENLAEVSKALGYDAYYLALLFRNSRTLIINGATTMGLSYDEADMLYLDKFDKYLTVFSKNAENYADNPEQLFYDLDQHLDKPASETKSKYMATFFVNFTNVVSVLDVTVKDLIIVRDDIDQLVTDLPPKIRKEIDPFIGSIFKTFDTFIEERYTPVIVSLKDNLKLVGAKLDTDSENLFQLTKRLINPVDYLLEIDDMPLGAKLEQQGKLNELVTRSLHTEAASMVEIAKPTQSELLAIARAKRVPTKLLVGLPPEFPDPITPAGVSPKPRKTWFVGDF